jgi:cytochrome c
MEHSRNRRDELLCMALGLLMAVAGLPAQPARAQAMLHGDPAHGKVLYQACMGCHSLDDNDVGPKHRGVVGRHSAAVPDYNYSPALKASGLVWTPANLDRWLTNPQKLAPGAKMFFSVASGQNRADIIAYLAEQR